MEPEQWGIYANDKLDIIANQTLFEDAGTTAFINNALIPVVEAIGDHNALMSWEVFNEPEGMTSECQGWTTQKMALAKIQKFTNKVAAAIHTINPKLLVSTGSVNINFKSIGTMQLSLLQAAKPTVRLTFSKHTTTHTTKGMSLAHL